MQRIGAVIVFKPDVNQEEAARALEQIREVLDLPTETTEYETAEPNAHGARRVLGSHQRPFKITDVVHEFEEEYGSPVWYIP